MDFLKTGVNDFLDKPVTLEQLKEIIVKHCSQQLKIGFFPRVKSTPQIVHMVKS